MSKSTRPSLYLFHILSDGRSEEVNRVDKIVDYITEYGWIDITDSLDVICEVNTSCKNEGIILSWAIVDGRLYLIDNIKLIKFLS